VTAGWEKAGGSSGGGWSLGEYFQVSNRLCLGQSGLVARMHLFKVATGCEQMP